MEEDYLHENLVFSSGLKMQLDVFIQENNLAMEYQGEQHYADIFSLGVQWRYSQRDEEKRVACKAQGISLIEVPYWWDFNPDSLQATIHLHRPDLISAGKGIPIPDIPPNGFPKGSICES